MCARAAIRSSPAWVEAAIQICRPDVEAGKLGELAPVGRQRRRVVFDVAGDQDARRAERGEPLAVGLAAREAKIEMLREARR